MPSDDNWLKVHTFLVQHFLSEKPFTQAELFAVTDWTGQSPKTYWSKQIKQFLAPAGDKQFRVTEAFRRVATWDRFQKHASQMRTGAAPQYTSQTYENVLIYEFFMPLTNEEHLRASLDALFYRETIERRLRAVTLESLKKHFPEKAGESSDEHIKRTAEWASKKFGGYSISHVSGRYKAGELATFTEAAQMQLGGGRYLIDETTAIVRFIFPCGKPTERKPPFTTDHFEEVAIKAGEAPEAAAVDEASRIHWFFGLLFVQTILEVVNGEAEIWMVESGMRHRLHIWKVETETDSESDPES
jgi:hypothetical protein